MSFVATNHEAAGEPGGSISNNGFWPDLGVDDFRDDERLGRDIRNRRLDRALSAAMSDVNRQLARFQANQVDKGVGQAEAIPIEAWQTKDHYAALYIRAVYALAHADLLERYRDYAMSSAGGDRGETHDAAADDYRRASRWAVAEIEGRPHSTVELI